MGFAELFEEKWFEICFYDSLCYVAAVSSLEAPSKLNSNSPANVY